MKYNVGLTGFIDLGTSLGSVTCGRTVRRDKAHGWFLFSLWKIP